MDEPTADLIAKEASIFYHQDFPASGHNHFHISDAIYIYKAIWFTEQVRKELVKHDKDAAKRTQIPSI
jgi:hypothetical protein